MQWKNLCIEEPFDYTNTARSVYDVEVFQKIKYVFAQSYEKLQQTMDLKSILNEKFISFPEPQSHHYGYQQAPPHGHGQQQHHGHQHHNNNNMRDHHQRDHHNNYTNGNNNSFATTGSTP